MICADWPLVIFTWLLTRTSTAALHDFETLLAQSGFRSWLAASYLGGSLALYEAVPIREAQPETEVPAAVAGRLRHRVTPGTLLLDFWSLFFRIIPPYPRVHPGLYAVGHPGPDSPVLVTGNFDLTVRRLLRAIDGQVDAFQSGGIKKPGRISTQQKSVMVQPGH